MYARTGRRGTASARSNVNDINPLVPRSFVRSGVTKEIETRCKSRGIEIRALCVATSYLLVYIFWTTTLYMISLSDIFSIIFYPRLVCIYIDSYIFSVASFPSMRSPPDYLLAHSFSVIVFPSDRSRDVLPSDSRVRPPRPLSLSFAFSRPTEPDLSWSGNR